jgi:hypothetical protein
MKKAVQVLIILGTVIIIAGFFFRPYFVEASLKRQCAQSASDEIILLRALSNDAGSCARLSSPEESAVCNAWAGQRPELCPESTRDACVPVAERNPDKCPEQDTWCRAVASGNPLLCEGQGLVDEADIRDCQAWATRDEGVFVGDDCVNAELSRIAVAKQSAHWCRRIRNEAFRQSCLEAIA